MALTAIGRAVGPAGRLAMPALGLKRSEPTDERARQDNAILHDVCALLWERGVLPGGEPSFITLADYGHSERSKAVVFVFGPRGTEPHLVVKRSAWPEYNATLEHEHANLGLLREQLGAALRRTLPVPLMALRRDGEIAVAEGFVAGHSMYLETRSSFAPRRLVERHLRLARDWLLDFQRATRAGERRFADHPCGDAVARAFADYKRIFSPSAEEQAFIDQTVRKARELEDEPLSVVACQGDYWARNLILSDHGLSVLDWESYSDSGSPFFDMFKFTTSFGLNYPWHLGQWAEPAMAFRSTYSASGWMGRRVRSHLRDYCSRAGISPKLLEVCFPAFVAQRAVENFTRPVSALDSPDGESASVAGAALQGLSAKGQMWRSLFHECALMAGNACFG
jgi:hypothetical protein